MDPFDDKITLESNKTSGASTKPSSILFVCGKNSIRSPIAELLARRILGPGVFIASAGVIKGDRDPFVDVILAEEELSLDDRQPRGLEDLADGYFDLVITLSSLAHYTVLENMRGFSVEVEYWPIPDPTLVTGSREQIVSAYRSVRDSLKKQITERFTAEKA